MYYFIILLHLISSRISSTRSLLVPYAYISIELIDSILLPSLALNAILLTSSVNTLCFSLLNHCCDFIYIYIYIYFMNYLWIIYFRLFTSTLFFSSCFVIFSSWVASKQCLKSSNLVFVLWNTVLCVLLFYFHQYHLSNSHMFLILMRQTLSLVFYLIHFSLIQLLYFFF